ncbi:MAG: hypothetical protein JXJ04_22180 [Spirochaetales bacterium]|nr:hypothetical protein [Spirochaetales bacterium]
MKKRIDIYTMDRGKSKGAAAVCSWAVNAEYTRRGGSRGPEPLFGRRGGMKWNENFISSFYKEIT